MRMVTATVTLGVTGDIRHHDIKRIVRRALEKVANHERDDDGIRYIMRKVEMEDVLCHGEGKDGE